MSHARRRPLDPTKTPKLARIVAARAAGDRGAALDSDCDRIGVGVRECGTVALGIHLDGENILVSIDPGPAERLAADLIAAAAKAKAIRLKLEGN